jgi:ligand-binding sensor domain-containing protein/two-component sensor histidine kinase
MSGQQLLLKDYTTQDGLPDSRVAPIIQDSKGYLWFGTQSGLTRYDGSEFVNFSGAKEIPGIFGRYILEDYQGAIWFAFTGFARGGVLRFRKGDVTDFSTCVPGIGLGCLAEDPHHDIWIGAATGLARIRFLDSSRTTWETQCFPEYKARSLFVDSKGKLWIACANETVYTYIDGNFSVAATGLHTFLRAYAVCERQGAIWFGGLDGIHVVENGLLRFFSKADGLPDRGVWSFCEDRNGNFWVGTAKGLYRMKNDSVGTMIHGRTRFIKEPSFGDAIVYDMCLDAEGNVWFASHPGLRKLLASDMIVDFPGKEKVAAAGFGPIAQDPGGKIYFGSRNAGVFTLMNNILTTGTHVRPFTDLTVLAILPQFTTRVWFGIKNGGIILQDGQATYSYPDSLLRPYWNVHSLWDIGDGEILMGTARGLFIVDEQLLPQRLRHSDIDSLTVFDIAAYGNQYWLATDKGVYAVKIADDSIQEVQRPQFDLLHGGLVYTILVDNRQQIWFGTDGNGLVSFDGSTFRNFRRADGLGGERVYALAQDSLGYLWIGTSSGLSQFDDKSFKNFGYDVGLGEIGLHGLMVDRDGFLWVSSFPSITKVKPQKFYKSTRPPPVYIADMQVDTIHFTHGADIELDPNPAIITFRYAGLSFTNESSVRYRYMLEGFDQDWSPPGRMREVRYTHLGSGTYTFRVVARSADGVWSSKAAIISFQIRPPLWARWWFILLCFLLVSGSIYGIYTYRLNKLLELERTRSRIAMDLHDDIGASLTRISVLSEVAQHQERSSSEATLTTLSKIGTTARELIDSLGDIVWAVDPKHDDLQNVIRRIVQFGQETCEGRGIEFETEIAGDFSAARLSLDRRRDLFLIFKEAINNTVRHSQARNVRFCIIPDRAAAVLEFTDDGIGFDENMDKTGNGLQSMRERGARVGGCTIASMPGQGTTVSVIVKTA